MASKASLSSAFNIILFISLIIFMLKFLPQVDSRPLQKPNGHNHIQSDDEEKVTNSFSRNNKGKNMKLQAVHEMKDLPPFPNIIPDMPFAPFPPFPFPFTFPPPFDIPNIPPLPPFPSFPPLPFPPPAA